MRFIGDLKFLLSGQIIAEYVPVVISVVLPDDYVSFYIRIHLRRFMRSNYKLNRIVGFGSAEPVEVRNISSVNIPIAEKVILPDDYITPDSRALLVVFNKRDRSLFGFIPSPDVSGINIPITKEVVLPDNSCPVYSRALLVLLKRSDLKFHRVIQVGNVSAVNIKIPGVTILPDNRIAVDCGIAFIVINDV